MVSAAATAILAEVVLVTVTALCQLCVDGVFPHCLGLDFMTPRYPGVISADTIYISLQGTPQVGLSLLRKQ